MDAKYLTLTIYSCIDELDETDPILQLLVNDAFKSGRFSRLNLETTLDPVETYVTYVAQNQKPGPSHELVSSPNFEIHSSPGRMHFSFHLSAGLRC